MHEVNVESTIASIRQLLNEAEHSLRPLGRQNDGGNDDWMYSHDISVALNKAFTQLLMLADALGLHQTYEQVRMAYDDAAKGEHKLATFVPDPDGNLHLLAASDIRRFTSGFEAISGLKQSHVVSKNVIEVLRATQYAITDQSCFRTPPASEIDVHRRIEAVLRCIFPDLDHKPPVLKSVKNFVPDTGLPSMRTLIEYKFVQDGSDVKRVADEILADTQGYKSNDWDKFVFLIYETRRLKSEKQWNRLLRQCGTALNTQAIVICGEVPKPKLKQGTSQVQE